MNGIGKSVVTGLDGGDAGEMTQAFWEGMAEGANYEIDYVKDLNEQRIKGKDISSLLPKERVYIIDKV